MAKLTDKQKRFVTEYLVDLNATQAAIRAGYSQKTAGSAANENLRKPQISAEIQKRQAKVQDKLEITQERIVKELAAIAFSSGTDFAEVNEAEGGQSVRFKATEGLPPEKRAAISSIKTMRGGMEVKTYDKLRAMELLGKFLGFLDGADKGKATSLADAVRAAYTQRQEQGDA